MIANCITCRTIRAFLASHTMLGLFVLVGCGTGEYDERMKTSLTQYERVHRFAALKPYDKKLAGDHVSLRVPAIFADETLAVNLPGQPVDKDQITPPFLNIPGISASYRKEIQDPQYNRMHFFIYLAAMEPQAAGEGKASLDEQITLELKKQFPNAEMKWEEVSCETDAGPVDALKWRRLSVSGEQMFERLNPNNVPEFNKFPGTFDLWYHPDPNYQVIVAWRLPDALKNSVADLESIKKRTAGTLKITPPEKWTNDAAVTEQLTGDGGLGNYRLKIPNTFKSAPARAVTTGVFDVAWAGENAGPGVRNLVGFVQPEPTNQLPKSLEQHSETALKLAVNPLQTKVFEPASHGIINGLRFIRVGFSGTDAQNNTVRGCVYCGRDGDNIISFSCIGIGSEGESHIKFSEAAVRTLQKPN